MINNKKPTIAVMVSVLNWWLSHEIVRGIRSAADEKEINLRFFVGGRIYSPFKAERDRNAVFDMINEHNTDGIIFLSPGFCDFLSPGKQEEYFKRFDPLPAVGIGELAGRFPQIITDNKSGIKKMVDHLIRDHGYQKIAFISGPLSNGDAVMRLEAFKEALAENQRELDPNYIVYGDFVWNCGKKMVKQLLDERNLSPEVIVCANDEMAFGVYYELKKRGIEIPGRIALTGFDDVREAQYTFPPMTTVKQPFFAQGAASINLILKLLDQAGENNLSRADVFESVVLPADLVIRKSCGCGITGGISPPVKKKKSPRTIPKKKQDLDSFSSDLINRLGDMYTLLSEKKKESLRSLYLNLAEDLKNGGYSSFLKVLHKQVYQDGVTELLIDQWRKIINCFSTHINEVSNNPSIAQAMERLQREANTIIEEGRNAIFGKRKVQADLKVRTYRIALERIGECLSIENLLEAIQVSFTEMGMECIYLSFYPDKQLGYPPEALPIKEASLQLGFDGEKVICCPDKTLFPISDLVPGQNFKYRDNNHFIIYPIVKNSCYFGILLVEHYNDEEKLNIQAALVERLCAALWTIKQFNDVEQTVKERTEELRGANEKLKELDTAKTNFMANISHELRTPLTLILGPIEALLAGDYGNPVDIGHESFEAMQANSVRLLKLINNLLDFSKIEAGKMKITKKKINITKLLNFYVNSLHSGIESRGLTINLIAPKEELVISIDQDLMEKAFFNLISNAMKFSRQGGSITVRLSEETDQVHISVQDQGIGIAPDKLEFIFERFSQVEQSTTRKYEGTGIGLAFTRDIVELHRGTIRVESVVGEGSTFIISLPREDETAGQPVIDKPAADKKTAEFPGRKEKREQTDHGKIEKYAQYEGQKNPFETEIADFNDISKQPAPENAPMGNSPSGEFSDGSRNGKTGETILIVDDYRDMRAFLKSLLGKTYTLLTAQHGKEALKVIARTPPDLIISDIMMPEMDGLELCRILKENKSTCMIPLILLTARMDLTTRLKGLTRKADDYLLKPFNSKELFARVENLLEKHRLEVDLEETTRALWSEMETAKQIQNSLLPVNPVIKGFDLACFIKSASEVGGDYYDIINRTDSSLLIIGDVSGHGITAGLVMMMVQTAINAALAANPDLSPSGLLSVINGTIKQNISKLGQEKYMTIMVFSLTPEGRVIYSGLHQDIFIYRAASRTVEVVESKGMWIGFIDDISNLVKDDTLSLEKGDALLLYTDGITEAVKKEKNPGTRRKRFGNDRLADLFRENGQKTPQEIKNLLTGELEHYICDDDFTFVIVKRT